MARFAQPMAGWLLQSIIAIARSRRAPALLQPPSHEFHEPNSIADERTLMFGARRDR
jgi:hypothetical protein